MKILYTILLVAFSIAAACCQTIDRAKGGKYQFQDSMYRSTQLSSVMSQNEEAFVQYQKYLRLEKNKDIAAQAGMITTFGSLALFGYLAISNVNSQKPNTDAIVYQGLGFASAGFLTALFGFYPSQHLLNKAVDIYNKDVPSTDLESSIYLGSTANGVGMVYSF